MGVNEEAGDKPVGLFTSEPYSQFDYQVEQLRDLKRFEGFSRCPYIKLRFKPFIV
jgi:hypothetical protein